MPTSEGHVMKTVQRTDEGWIIQCPDCGRAKVIFRDGSPPEHLYDGDPMVQHTWSSTSTLVIGPVEL